MRLLAPLSASAAVALLAACPCGQPAKSAPVPMAELPTPELYAEYVPANDGTFQALARVSAAGAKGTSCLELDANAQSDLSGASLPRSEASSTAPACACRSPTFIGAGTIPAATDGTFTVQDETGNVSVTVPSLFVEPTVAIEDQGGRALSALSRSSRVYFAFAPANVTEMTDVVVSFVATGAAEPSFTKTSEAGGGVVKDGTRWCFEVPSFAPAVEGVLEVRTLATLQTTGCTMAPVTDALTCTVVSLATRRLSTSVQ